jgi:hypothetical protein
MSEPTLREALKALRVLACGGVTRTSVDAAERALRNAGLDELGDVESFLYVCASFRPGGGNYLYDEQAVMSEARYLLSELPERADDSEKGVDNA